MDEWLLWMKKPSWNDRKAPKYDTIYKGKSHYSRYFFLDAIFCKNWRKSFKKYDAICMSKSLYFNFFGRKNLHKMREKLPNMTQFIWGSHSISTLLDAKICTTWGNKPPKYDAISINFGDKNLSFGMGVHAENWPLVFPENLGRRKSSKSDAY